MSNILFNSRTRRFVQAGAVVLALGVGYQLRDVVAQGGTSSVPPSQKNPVETAATRDAAATQNAFVDVAKAVQSAVVTIETPGAREVGAGANPRSRPPAPGGGNPFDNFQEFFREFQRGQGLEPQSFNENSWTGRVLKEQAQAKFKLIQSRRGGGLGSGLIYREDGLIMTNAHVVRGAETVTVTLSDGRKFDKAKVLGRDERTDIAVVKIDATKLPTVSLGDSEDVRVGDWAIAVGNPFGLDHTLTVGVISAKSRELNLATGGDTRTDYLQTDASINPGNSGGPLLDIYGRVIGINNAIYSESGGNQGIGFAIPVNTARFVAERISKEGRVRRSYLGVSIGNVEDQGAAFGLDPKLKGVLIRDISDPSGPGAKAGLQPGDVVTRFNGQVVTRSSELQRLVGNSPVGSQVTLDVVRGDRTVQLKATLQELKDGAMRPTPSTPNTPDNNATSGTSSAIPGLKTRNLTPELARALDIKATKGVVVTTVEANTPAADAGLRRGDVIEQVGQTKIGTVAEMEARVSAVLARQTNKKQVALFISRADERSIVIVEIE